MTVWLGSPNYATAPGRRILGMVIHSSEGSLDAMTAVFNRPGGASAHYAIGSDGRRYQYVRDADVAFHVAAFGNDPSLNRNRPNWLPAYNGRYSAVNASTIGIELEGFAAQGFTPAQYAELGRLLAEKSDEHGFDPTFQVDAGADARVLTHGWLQTDRSDPGPRFWWEDLRGSLLNALSTDEEEDEMALTAEQQRILDAAARNGLDDAGIDQLVGVNRTLGEQVNSLSWLLRVSQEETAAQAAEVARLQSQTSASTVGVQGVNVTLTDGRVESLTH